MSRMETTRNGTTYAVSTKISLGSLVSVLALAAAGFGAWADMGARITATQAQIDVMNAGGTDRLRDHMNTAVKMRDDAVEQARDEREALRARVAKLERCVRRPKGCQL